MKKSIYFYTVVGLVTIFSHVVLAETTPNSDFNKVLSNQTVIEQVLTNNLELKALKSEMLSKEALLRQAKAWKNPE
ncbi:MAG: hypothetical protein VW378_06280, partial [bacterium]